MKVVHITRDKNLSGINRLGILRNKSPLSQYDELMAIDYPGYRPEIGLVFSYLLNDSAERFLKDFAYWDTWGKPRNDCLKKMEYPDFCNLKEMGPKGFKNIHLSSNRYFAILLDIEYHPLYDIYIHEQTHTMAPFWSDMDSRYEHIDKPLALINYDVPRERILGIIGSANSEIKNNKVYVNSKMNKLRGL